MRRYLQAALAGSLLVGGVSLVAMIAGTAPASAQPAVSLYVASGGSGDCTSQLNACGSIQTAITTAEGVSYSGDDVTINVAAGTYTENDTISGASFNSLTIAGAGASTTTVNGNQAGSVFTINGGTVTIDDLTITNGLSAGGYGDGIDITGGAGPVTVNDSTLSDNGTASGGAGGGIYNFDDTLTVTDSLFSNDNRYFGGAINSNGGTLTLTDSTLSGNSSAAGGGIDNGGMATVTDSTLSGEPYTSNGSAGGIYNTGTMTVTHSTVSGNSVGGSGGAITNIGTMTLTDSTLSGNSAGYIGGGIANAGTMTLTDSTLSDNSAPGGHGGGIYNDSTINLGATIVANSSSGGDCYLPGGTFNDLGYNLDDDGSCNLTATGDVSDTPADLDPTGLQNNGGPTQTIALEAGSPAIRAVSDPSLCPSTDQRGYVRNVPCDMGAYQSDSVLAPCAPGSTGCSAMLSAPSQTVAVSGTKALEASASIKLVVVPAVLSCANFSYQAPVATLTDSGLAGTSVTLTDTVKGLPSKKGVVICYQSVGDSDQTPVFLAKCHGSHFVPPCYKSISEVAGSVVAKLELPLGDPRFHIGGETPSVTSYSPRSAKAGKKLTIKGTNLSEITGVTIGGVPAHINATAPTKVSVTVPAGAKGGVVAVSSLAGVVSGPSVTVSGAQIPVNASKLRETSTGGADTDHPA